MNVADAPVDRALLDSIVKAYDIRGTVPDQLDADFCRSVGSAFVQVLAEEGPVPGVVIGYDMRPSSPTLARAFADGVARMGVDVTIVGLASTDQLYCASGLLGLPGAMFTASHNPAQYNGIKLCRAYAAPVGQDSGLRGIADLLAAGVRSEGAGGAGGRQGEISERDMLADYVAHLHSLVDLSSIRQLRVVVDAGNGMAGRTAPAVLDGLPLTVVPLFFELDGSFPNHEANPIEPENMRDLQAAVTTHQADIGLAFDGDADRCFVVDERGEIVSPSLLTALIADRELARDPGGTVIHNLITSRVVPEVVAEAGGTAVRSRVGHSFIKAVMAETGAVFGGEHSGHFYFRDFWRADSGMLAALHVLAALGASDRPLSQLLEPYQRYVASGEINSTVREQAETIAAIRERWLAVDGATVDELDGLTVDGDDWWFNVRASNTEPLLRLNVEAKDEERMSQVRDEVLEQIRGGQ